ncbi:MAG: LysR family transcriptional regulator [Planctomycetes bacterium]|nr:LysR family transcriptional regulator [Planctomycetota bacterium]
MELHQLRYFVSVADEENFTRAAEACQVAQPSLSQQIIKLEKELGQKLFERLGRRVKMTDAGKFLYDRATSILANVDHTKADMLDDLATGEGRVAIGAIITAAPFLIPLLLKAFGRSYPKADIIVHEDLTDHILAECRRGDLDIGLVALPINDTQLHIEPLFKDELLLCVHHKHKLATKRKVSIQDISQEPFILLDPIHCLGEQVVSFCRGNECRPKVVCRSSQILTVQELVALDHGVSLLPASAAKIDKSKQRKYISLSGVRPHRTMAMVWHKKRHQSRVVCALVDTIREQLVSELK